MLRLLNAARLAPLIALAAALTACPEGAPDTDDGGEVVFDPNDVDNDGVPNARDEDIDNDGAPNTEDDDIDGDGTPNTEDDSDFGEGDQVGPQGDIDSDGLPNNNDDDDDGDGIPDGVIGDGTCDDGETTSGDEAADCDGFCFSPEGGYFGCDDGAPPGSGVPDNDGDGVSDPLDPDDDNDGIPDDEDPNDNGEEPTPECSSETFGTGEDVLDPRILLLVDKSGSMDEGAAGFGGNKWDTAVDALSAVAQSLDGSVELGLMLYPPPGGGSASCEEGELSVNVAPNNADAIIDELQDNEPGGRTPTAASLTAAQDVLDALDADGGARAVVLATDGGPNCNDSLDGDTCRCVGDPQDCQDNPISCLDDVDTIAAATALNAAGYPVFVVGIPGAEDFRDVLNAMAVAGGTGQSGDPAFYDASSSDALTAALEDIAVRVGACRFDLARSAAGATITVTVGGSAIAQDTSRTNGWDLVDNNTVELFGAACQAAVSGGAAAASVTVEVCSTPPPAGG